MGNQELGAQKKLNSNIELFVLRYSHFLYAYKQQFKKKTIILVIKD